VKSIWREEQLNAKNLPSQNSPAGGPVRVLFTRSLVCSNPYRRQTGVGIIAAAAKSGEKWKNGRIFEAEGGKKACRR